MIKAAKNESAGSVVMSALGKRDIRKIFGITGSHITGIYDAILGTSGTSIVNARHEGGAAFMAAGWARLTGEIGIVVVTAGPGVLNALNGLGQAAFSALPMVVIGGGVPTGSVPYDLHGLDNEKAIIDAVKPLTKAAFRPTDLRMLERDLETGFELAQKGRPGPVYIEIPWNLFGYIDSVKGRSNSAGKGPLLVVDKLALKDPYLDDALNAATALGARVAVTRDAIGVISDDDPCWAGVVHNHQFGTEGFDAVVSATAIALVGFEPTSRNRDLVLKRSDVAKDVAASELEAWVSAQDVVERPGANNNRKQLHRQRIASDPDAHPFLAFLAAVSQDLDGNEVTVIDAGSHEVWTRNLFPFTSRHSCVSGADWASMGFAIPTTIAARHAFPNRRVVTTTGDGCLLMSLADLSPLIEAGGPTVVAVLNDTCYGMMEDVANRSYGRSSGAELPKIDVAGIATAMGCRGLVVRDAAEAREAAVEAMQTSVPLMVDIRCRSVPNYVDWACENN